MGALKITVHGSSTVQRRAERAVMSVSVSCKESSQEAATSTIATTSTELQELFRSLASEDLASEDAAGVAVTKWSMGTLSTGSYDLWEGEKDLPREYTAYTSLEATFRDFSKLGSTVTTLSKMPHVSINHVSWDIKKATRLELTSETRRSAVKDAFEKATDYAAAAGKEKSLSPIELNDDDSDFSPFHPVMRTFGGAGGVEEAKPELSFSPEDVTIASQVTMIFMAE